MTLKAQFKVLGVIAAAIAVVVGLRIVLRGDTSAGYSPKAVFVLAVAASQRERFLVTADRFAAENGFSLVQDMTGFQLADGRRIVSLDYERPDGIEMAVTAIFKPDEFNVVFYDKRETGAWQSLKDDFEKLIQPGFDR